MRAVFAWINRHPIWTSTIVIAAIVFVILGIPFFIQLAINTPSNFAKSSNNDWIGFWGGYLGGLLGAIGIFITIQFEIYRWKEQIRIDSTPYFHIGKIELSTKESEYFPLNWILSEDEKLSKALILPYNFTDEGSQHKPFVFSIKNLSKVHALDLRFGIYDEKDKSPFKTEIKQLDILQPDETIYLCINASYEIEDIKGKIPEGIINLPKDLIVRICYNTVHDAVLENEITAENFYDNWGRANHQDIHISINAFIDEDELTWRSSFGTRRIESGDKKKGQPKPSPK